MPLPAGTRLGAYEIIAPLGSGGMGEVYRARDTRLGREVAVKVLPADVASDPNRLARFEREARTVAALNHPNIVVLHSIEDAGGVRFITMELIEGQSLDKCLAPGGLPVPRVIELGIALADALTAAHDKGVVHRDLKPANVMLARDGRLKVLDFGLAKPETVAPAPQNSQAATVASPLSGTGMITGTVPYMAPEQIRGDPVDARSDLFALGIVLYELLAGKRPFTGETHVDVSHAVLRGTPQPLAAVRPDLPQDLERIIGRCLEKSARERPQTAVDVSNVLHRLRKDLERGESVALARPTSEKTASIAVLPFMNRSASADDEYFSDGLADELLSVLAKIKGLRVTARTSAFHFKGKDTTIAEIGRALNVATVLEGSVRKAGSRVRISVNLVDVRDSSPLWSETYDRTLEDIFAVQDDIAQSVVKELRTTLLGQMADSDASGKARAEVAQAAKGRGTDPEAHRLYLLAQHLVDRFTHEDNVKAVEYLKEALTRDPEFALAWVVLARAYGKQADYGWAPTKEAQDRARDAMTRALALAPDLAEAHVRMGAIRSDYDRDFRGAQASYARALELAPGNALALCGAGWMAWIQGRVEEAISFLRRALEQDPLSASAYTNLGLALHAANRLGEAEAAYQRVLELAPQRVVTRALLSLTLLAQGRGEEALAEARREPEEAYRLWAEAIIHHVIGHGAESDAALEQLVEIGAETMAMQIAQVHGARGDVDRAFEWLERAYRQRDSGLVQTKPSSRFRTLHDDPRWGAFLKKIGLDDSDAP